MNNSVRSDNCEKSNKIIKLVNFHHKTQINCVVASYNFVHFLSVSGQLYSLGSNINGQLGN